MAKGIQRIRQVVKEVSGLQRLSIVLDKSETGKRLYRAFTKPHPRLLLVKNKSLGVGIIALDEFATAGDYLKSVNGKNSAAYFTRKAARAGYTFLSINPNEMHEAIMKVNTSAGSRQGRAMDESYTKKMLQYPVDAHNLYFAVMKNGELAAYLWVVRSGELAVLNRLLGHAAHLEHGIMYMLVTGFVEQELVNRTGTRFIMYDTFFGASEGLRLFKTRCGFKPYRVKWEQG